MVPEHNFELVQIYGFSDTIVVHDKLACSKSTIFGDIWHGKVQVNVVSTIYVCN